MADQRELAARRVWSFLGRLSVQIVLSASAMSAIHLGLRVMPDLGPWFGQEAQAVATVAAPPAMQPPVIAAQAFDKGDRLPPPAAGFAGPAPMIEAIPIPEAAPERPIQTASLVKPHPKAGGVQRFDACAPACPSRDPLLREQPEAVPQVIPIADRGTEFPEQLDDGSDDASSLLSLPGDALGAAGRTTRNVWNRVETLLPF